jgi:hypothetical protein
MPHGNNIYTEKVYLLLVVLWRKEPFCSMEILPTTIKENSALKEVHKTSMAHFCAYAIARAPAPICCEYIGNFNCMDSQRWITLREGHMHRLSGQVDIN